MYELHYGYVKRKYNAKLWLVYEDFYRDKNLFDFSNLKIFKSCQ